MSIMMNAFLQFTFVYNLFFFCYTYFVSGKCPTYPDRGIIITEQLANTQ